MGNTLLYAQSMTTYGENDEVTKGLIRLIVDADIPVNTALGVRLQQFKTRRYFYLKSMKFLSIVLQHSFAPEQQTAILA